MYLGQVGVLSLEALLRRPGEEQDDVGEELCLLAAAEALEGRVVAQHVVDAGEVAGILLEALRVVEAGRVDDAFRGGRERKVIISHIYLTEEVLY